MKLTNYAKKTRWNVLYIRVYDVIYVEFKAS